MRNAFTIPQKGHFEMKDYIQYIYMDFGKFAVLFMQRHAYICKIAHVSRLLKVILTIYSLAHIGITHTHSHVGSRK